MEMSCHEYSLNTNKLTLVATATKHYTVHSDSNKDFTDMLNHMQTYKVSSSYLKWLYEYRIISGPLLKL